MTQDFVKLTLKEEYSKTKGRVISLYWKNSLTSVKEYIEEREQEGIKSNEPVFKKTYDAVRMFLHRLGKRTLKREINPHLFRHSSCTFYASKLNRQEMCYRYGWAFSSKMADVYIDRAGMVSPELDGKFKVTQVEKLEKEIQVERMDNSLKLEAIEKKYQELQNIIERMAKVKGIKQ